MPAPVTPEVPPEPSPEPLPEPSPEPEPEPSGAYGPRTVVIDQPEDETEERPTLAEAARRARESRSEESSEPLAVITDENLPHYATGALSEAAEDHASTGADAAATDTAATETGTEAAAEERGEEYWRDRIRDARLRWRDLVEEIERTEGEAAELRQRFYAEDDGFFRDSQIKPAWDRALDRLAELRDRVGLARESVENILLEARQAGALPGWLREGIEYEPRAEEPAEDLDIHEATEPQVIEPDDEGDR